ncbi:B12-binding domain-containing protein [Cypionkella sp.]|jgi:MerR family transcriptional regulator, light-induced transcriptional regulator|uniref:cobalamin B12-binding domain-containing protein n=1 Tax=Cypionkella sp. TaxID=2811411 RepID=UPI00375257D0
MQAFQSRDQVQTASQDGGAVSFFASQVVSLLANRNARTVSELREPVVAGLVAASTSGSKDAFVSLLAEVRRTRITLAALADIYIPEAARRMGEAWQEDRMSWMDVSIGVGRMQSLLREIGTAWVADQAGDAGHGTVLLLVTEREQHTLGPMVLMGQLRRYGVSVCLRIAPTYTELSTLLAARQFDGILISLSTKDKLEPVAKTVEFLKTLTSNPCPIIVGGAVMSKVEDLATHTGADYSTNDIGAALEVIGLKFDASCVLRRA